jgi:hypothetical protein
MTNNYVIAYYGQGLPSGGWNGTQFANVVINGNAVINGGINYNYGSAGEIELNLTVIPEPGTWGMMLCGTGMLIAFQRKRRRNF